MHTRTLALLLASALIVGLNPQPGSELEPVAAAPPAPGLRILAAPRDGDPARLAARHGLRLERWLPALGLAVLEGGDAQALNALRQDPQVRHASRDLRLQLTAQGCCAEVPQDVDLEPAFRVEHQRLERTFGPLRQLSRGEGQLVAVIDTGCDGDHPALSGRLVTGLSLLPDAPWNEDVHGHGTAMASLIAGSWSDGDGCPVQEGVAPAARVLPVRVAGPDGLARLSDVAAGVVAAVDRGASVILLSMGARLPAPALTDAISYAADRDVVVVAAAGNRNVHHDLFPAADPRVLSVACVADNGELAAGTALSATTDLLAPGIEVAAAQPREGLAHLTGTSVAAARIAGVVAIVRALRPELDAAAVRRVVSAGSRPLPLFVDDALLRRAFPAGALDAARLAQALTGSASPTLAEPQVFRAGDELRCRVRVVNRSAQATPLQVLTASVSEVDLVSLPVPALAPGEQRELELRLPAKVGGPVELRLGESRVEAAIGSGPLAPDLGIVSVEPRFDPLGGVVLRVQLEARGLPESGIVEARLDGEPVSSTAFALLTAGDRTLLDLPVPTHVLAKVPDLFQVELILAGREPDVSPADDRATVDLLAPLAGPRPMRTQYQQSDKTNWVADAPTRLEPQRSYLPIMFFLPEKGDTDPNTTVHIRRAKITVRDVPQTSGPGTVIYEDRHGGVTTAPPGLVLTDEDGDPIMQGGVPDVRLFRHDKLTMPGSYTILRMPRAAIGVAGNPTQVETRYVEVDFEWRRRRRFLGLIKNTKTDDTRWVLKVDFASDPLPRLPGDSGGSYFDAHCHAITEWHQDSSFNPLSPKKNWGGPIPMIKEAAHAIGLTDAVDAARGRVITTDHNAGFNAGDDLQHRPQLGPSSPGSAGPGVNEFQAFRNVFGITAGEEVTIAGSIRVVKLGPIKLNLPNGAHLLTYRGEHMDGPWHGGSALARALGDPSPDFTMDIVLDRLTQTNRALNKDAAGYAAHPFGDNDWTKEHFQFGFQMDAARRTDLPVHAEQTGFVTKGVQFWNGDGKRNRLDSSLVDWNDLNPWVDPSFVRGRDDWDSKTIHRHLRTYHEELIEPLLSYELAALPGVRFPRKVFMAAGNDAHGDFNFHTDRTATIVKSQSGFQVDGRAFGDVKTYAMPYGQTASDPAERAFEALIDGNSVLTDGPILVFSLDGEDRFHGGDLAWHDQRQAFEDRDGRIGGGGAFDGRGTLLVRRGSPQVRFGYRHINTAEFDGDVESVLIHRTSPGDVNPEGKKPASRGGKSFFEPRGTLVAGSPNTDLEEAIDPAEEGTIDAVSAIHLIGYTHPDPKDIAPDGRRCVTNPVWCVPFDAQASIARVETLSGGKGVIPPGELTVTFEFDMSLQPNRYAVELKALDTAGDSTAKASGPIDMLTPVGSNNGWSARNGALNSRLTLTNTAPIPLDLDRYPGASEVTFVVYTYDTLRDPFGNELNPLAFTFTTQGIGTGGGTGPALVRSTPGSGPGTTAPGATPGTPAPGGGGGGGGGGCALAQTPRGAAGPWGLLGLVGLLALARACGGESGA